MWRAFNDITAWLRGRSSVKAPSIVSHSADDAGVTITKNDGTPSFAFRWDDIDEIHSYKVDLLTYDDICLAMHGPEGWVELSEEFTGFVDVVSAMQRRFPSIPESWYFDVMQPPFATNHRVLWRRGEQAVT